jgi:hypothetical protein
MKSHSQSDRRRQNAQLLQDLSDQPELNLQTETDVVSFEIKDKDMKF